MIWNIFQWRSLKTRVTLLTLAIVFAGIWVPRFYASRMFGEEMTRQLGEQQFSTASIVAAQVNAEVVQRLTLLEKVANTITPAMMNNPAALQTRLEDQATLIWLFNNGIAVVGPDGAAIADAPRLAGRVGTNYMERDFVIRPLRDGKSTVGQPIISRATKTPIITMAVPIRDTQNKVIGVLGGVTDLGKPNFLQEVAANRYGKTGGYILVATQPRLVVTATDKIRIMERLPAAGQPPLLDRFLNQGFEGSDVVVNPHGVESLISLKGIPAADWYLVAALPTAEAFAPIRDMQQRMLLTTTLLTLLAGGLTWWILSRQLKPLTDAARLLAKWSNSDQPIQPLPIARQDEIGGLIRGFNRQLEAVENRGAALRSAEEQFRGLVEQSIAGIYIVQDGKFVYVNPRFAEIYGYASVNELIGREPVSLVSEADRGMAARNFRQLIDGEVQGMAYGVIGQRKDGTAIEVDGHGTRAEYRGRPAIIGMLQDISEKKRADEQIQRYVEQLKAAFMSTVEVATTLSEMRDPYTAGHERRVAEIAVAIGAELGFDAARREGLRVAGHLHDIGKITVPSEILSKPGKLSTIEYQLIQGHAQASYDVLKDVTFPWPVAEVALQHHERVDGSGYPGGLKGDAILLEARVLAVADVIEAMSSHRPYRPGLGIEAALAEIERGRGTAYDPIVADACLKLFREKHYTLPA